VDIYALGVIMYEMLTGKVPFDRPNSVNILMAHIHEQVPPCHVLNPNVRVPPQLEEVVMRCMAKNVEDRYASMNDLLTALKRCAGLQSSTMSGDFQVTESVDIDMSGASVSTQLPAMPAPVSSMTPIGPFAQASKSSGSSGVTLFLAAIFALTGIGGFLVLSGQFDSSPAAATPAPALATAPEVAPAPAPGPTAGQGRTVLVSLRSTPSGATVVVGDRRYGPTPTQIEWSGPDAAYGREITFRFQRKGYRDLTVTRRIRGDHLDVEAPPLEPLQAQRPSRDTQASAPVDEEP
jgi:serine/threonine-protein kinase